MQEMPLTWVQPLSWKDTQEKEMLIHSSILAWKICKEADTTELLLLLLLSRFSRVQLCATPETAAHQAPLSLDSPGKNTGVGCHFLLQCMEVKSESEVAQSCPTPSDPMDCSD